MSGRDSFGPNLRRIREQRGIALETIAERTNVDVDLWEGLERNDFTRWPTGIYARAFVADYARELGVDADSTVNDFCRWFPQGDRRRGNLVRAKAELLGVRSELYEDRPRHDRRRRTPEPSPLDGARRVLLTRRWRAAATSFDLAATACGGAALGRLLQTNRWGTVGAVALSYYGVSTLLMGCSPGAALVTAWLRHSVKAELRALGETIFVRVRRVETTSRS